jgi:hypothetical protein
MKEPLTTRLPFLLLNQDQTDRILNLINLPKPPSIEELEGKINEIGIPTSKPLNPLTPWVNLRVLKNKDGYIQPRYFKHLRSVENDIATVSINFSFLCQHGGILSLTNKKKERLQEIFNLYKIGQQKVNIAELNITPYYPNFCDCDCIDCCNESH